jgi:hypothetical protein
MPVIVRSLINESQTIDSVALAAWEVQTRSQSTAALVAAVAAKTIQMDTVDDVGQEDDLAETVYVYVPANGGTVNVPDDAEVVHVSPAGTIAGATLNMPTGPVDGQRVSITTNAVITTLTHAATGKTLKGAWTAGAVGQFGTWKYRAADTTWYRVG